MRLAEIPIGTPPELLAWDEAFLQDVENGAGEVLWFWESPIHFVVVGYGQCLTREVNTEACQQEGVPVLRRSSGGGTVLQGPGCLSYGVVLRLDHHPVLQTVTGANRWIMERQAAALNRLLNGTVVVRGHTDLAWVNPGGEERKFSGNAQRRTRQAVLFHGTVLHGLDLGKITQFLRHPAAQPDYRSNRLHAEFLVNLPLAPDALRQALMDQWQVRDTAAPLPKERHEHALSARYRIRSWHERRVTPPAAAEATSLPVTPIGAEA